MAQPPVELDQDPLIGIAHVVSLATTARAVQLPHADGQTVSTLDVVAVPTFHRALDPVGGGAENHGEQRALRMPRSVAEPGHDHGLVGQALLERPPEQGERLVRRRRSR